MFLITKDIFNYRDIYYFSFFNNGTIFFMINIYLDSNQSTLKYIKDTEANLQNVLIMIGDFNIKDSVWNSLFSFHLSHSDSSLETVDSFNLCLSSPIQQVSTQYSDNNNNANSVIDLFFLWPGSIELNNHSISPELYFPLDYAPLIIDIIIEEKFIQNKRWSIVKNSKDKLIQGLKNINTLNTHDKNSLEQIVQEYIDLSESAWFKHSCLVHIMRWSKDWWNKSYQEKLMAYRISKRVEN